MKIQKRILTLSVAVILGICNVGCSGSLGVNYDGVEINMYDGENAITDLVVVSENPATIIPQYSQSGVDISLLQNTVDNLLTLDAGGNIIGNAAKKWSFSSDYKQWTFKLRDDLKWVDCHGNIMGDVTARDFAAGIELVLNVSKSGGTYAGYIYDYIDGAFEYCEYTSSLDTDDAMRLNVDDMLKKVNISIPDDNTIVFDLVDSFPYFDTAIAALLYYSPAPDELINKYSCETYKGLDFDELWYCGPYVISDRIVGNQIILEANPNWWGNETNTRFMSVTYKILNDKGLQYQLYRNGELDEITLERSDTLKILENPNDKYYDKIYSNRLGYSAYLAFNYKMKEGLNDDWNIAIANENFRKSLYYGFDSSSLLEYYNSAEPLINDKFSVTAQYTSHFSDGRDYIYEVENKIDIEPYDGKNLRRVNKNKALKYKEIAIEELKEEGVSFPVNVILYTSMDNANMGRIIGKGLTDILGSDYIDFTLKTYTSNLHDSIYHPGLESICFVQWDADYGDPMAYLEIFDIQKGASFYSDIATHIFDVIDETETYQEELVASYNEYHRLLKKAKSTYNYDERLRLLSDAEAYLINHALVIPICKTSKPMLSKIDPSSRPFTYTNQFTSRMVNLRTNKNGYVTRENVE